MNRSMKTVVVLLAGVSASGCATSLRVSKVYDCATSTGRDVQGVRYSLPRVFVVVIPDPEVPGGFKVEQRLLPDTCETYAIQAKTFLSTYSLDVDVKEGLLKKVTLSGDSSATPGAALTDAANYLKQDLEERAKAAEESEKAAQASATKEAALEKAVTDAETEHQVAAKAVDEWEKLLEQAPADVSIKKSLLESRLRLEKGVLSLEQARRDLQEFRAQVSATSSSAVFDQPAEGAPAGDSAYPTVHGPVLYRLEDTCDPWEPEKDCRVTLVAAGWPPDVRKKQVPFQVSAVPPGPAEKALIPSVTNPQDPDHPDKVVFSAAGLHEHTIVLSHGICVDSALQVELRDASADLAASPLPSGLIGVAVESAGREILVQLRRGDLAKGIYSLRIEALWTENSDAKCAAKTVLEHWFDVP